MDNESLFLSALLQAPTAEHQRFFAASHPVALFNLRQREYIWLLNYWRQHQSLPSRQLFEATHGVLPRSKDTLAAAFQPLWDRHLYARLRQLNHHLKEELEAGKAVTSVVASFQKEVAALTGESTNLQVLDFAQSNRAIEDYVHQVAQRDEGGLLDFPWPSLNRLIGFMRPGETMICASRTSVGKTWLLCWLTHHYAAHRNVKVVATSAEMTTSALMTRLEAIHYKLPYDLMRHSALPPQILARWRKQRAADSRRHSKLSLRVAGADALGGFRLSTVQGLVGEFRPGVVMLDGAYLFKGTNSKPGREAGEVERLALLSHDINLMAKQGQCAVVAVVQLNRQAESEGGLSKGGLTNVYNSDAWAQDADFVLLLGGKRGHDQRTVSLVKGRESALGDFAIQFKVTPHPDFSETSFSAAQTNPGVVEFKGFA